MSDELALLAGGTVYERAVDEIADDIDTAKARLEAAHPFFYNEEFPIP